MNWLNEICEQIVLYVNIPYLLTFVLLSYFVKKQFGGLLQKITKFDWKTVYTVLIIATITAIPFLIFEGGWVKILFSYALGTTLHELIFKHIEGLFK